MLSVFIVLFPVAITTLWMSKTVPETFNWHLMCPRRSLASSRSSRGKSWHQDRSRTRPAWAHTSPNSMSFSGERLYLLQVEIFHYSSLRITDFVWNSILAYYHRYRITEDFFSSLHLLDLIDFHWIIIQKMIIQTLKTIIQTRNKNIIIHWWTETHQKPDNARLLKHRGIYYIHWRTRGLTRHRCG